MREIIITKKDEGQRLNKFIMKYLNQAPSSFVYKMLRKKNIVLNGAKAKGEEIVKAGDSVKLFLADETIDKFRVVDANPVKLKKAVDQKALKLDIIFENDDIIAVNKPVGMLSQKADKDDISINEFIVDYYNTNYKADEDTFKPSVCNRLDRNTSGIILAGKSLQGSQYLSRVLKDRSIDKYYYTIVKGLMKDKLHDIAYINKDENTNISAVISDADYKKLQMDFNHKDKSNTDKAHADKYSRIETEFIPVSASKDYTLLKVKLITGKSHQIRAHLAYLGYPVIGDNKYGDVYINRYFRDNYKLKGQLLHAGEVILSEDIKIKADLPGKFKQICEGLNLKYN